MLVVGTHALHLFFESFHLSDFKFQAHWQMQILIKCMLSSKYWKHNYTLRRNTCSILSFHSNSRYMTSKMQYILFSSSDVVGNVECVQSKRRLICLSCDCTVLTYKHVSIWKMKKLDNLFSWFFFFIYFDKIEVSVIYPVFNLEIN